MKKFKYTLIDKIAYDLYVQTTLKYRDIYTGYVTPFSDRGFQSFVEDHKIYNNCWLWYNDKRITQEIRKQKLQKLNDNRREN